MFFILVKLFIRGKDKKEQLFDLISLLFTIISNSFCRLSFFLLLSKFLFNILLTCEFPKKSYFEIVYACVIKVDESIKDKVDAHYFHYHPASDSVDLAEEFKALGLVEDWGAPDMFYKKVFREVRRYLLEDETFDPLAICFGVRAQIERRIYDNIGDLDNKRKFIDDNNGTKNKLLFAQSIGVQIPETYFLLGVIYNTSLHLEQGKDISKPLGLKL